MYYEPGKLNKFLISEMQRMNEDDTIEALGILQRRLANMRNEDYYLEIVIEELPLSTKARHLLVEKDLLTVKDLISYGLDNLWKIRSMGPKTIHKIKETIKRLEERKHLIKGLAGIDLKVALLKEL